MKTLITEFFQHIYEFTRAETPEFRIHAWQDKVIGAFLNPTDPASSDVLAREAGFQAQRSALNDTYDRVMSTVEAMPEELQPATLIVVSQQVPDVLVQLGLSESVRDQVMQELNEILISLDVQADHIAQVTTILSTPTPETATDIETEPETQEGGDVS